MVYVVYEERDCLLKALRSDDYACKVAKSYLTPSGSFRPLKLIIGYQLLVVQYVVSKIHYEFTT